MTTLHNILHTIASIYNTADEYLDYKFGDYTDRQLVIVKRLRRECEVLTQLAKVTGDFTQVYDKYQEIDNILQVLLTIN